MSRRVIVEARAVGVAFGCVGVVRDAKSRRKLAESDTVRPHGFAANAVTDAEQIAAARGWTVATTDDA